MENAAYCRLSIGKNFLRTGGSELANPDHPFGIKLLDLGAQMLVAGAKERVLLRPPATC